MNRSTAGRLRTVLIAVPTTGTRPLRTLLGELAEQAGAASRGGRTVSVLLIDNSGGCGSQEVRSAAVASGADYLEVRTRGYAQVRNAALEAGRQYDALVFIDDDEQPVPGWLEALVRGAEAYDADVVAGPVPVRLPPAAPRWLADGAMLRPQSCQPDGPLRGSAASGNTLIRMSTIERLDLWFNQCFDRTGGEDTAFFTELARRGAVLVWVGAAVAFETPDPERLALAYVVRRAYRSGAATALVERAVGGMPPTRRALRRAGRIARGLFRTVHGAAARNRTGCALGLVDIAFGCGWWIAVLARRDVTGCRTSPSRA
ncbi:glycosyltransferase family 2 protein [Streptomyces sp.]